MADSVKIKITGDDSQFSGVLEGLGDKARGTMNSVSSTFKGIMASQIVTKGLSLLSGAFRSTMATGMEFGEAMSKVAATSGATAEEIDILTAKAKEMGATTQFTASEAAEAMNYMAMAGWKTEEMMGGIEGIMHLAAASGEDLATTSDIVTDALTAFGMSAEESSHFADILAAASSNANTNVAMMGETFKYAAPLAGALGYDAEDVAVAIGLMANSGIKASQAGTAMQGWLTRMSKPTKESSEAMKALGLSITNTDGSMKPFMQMIEETRDAFGGLTESQKAEYAAMLAGQRGMSGLLAIVNSSEADFEKLAGAITECDGAAENMANVRMDNLAGDVKIMQSALEGLQITASESMDGTARTLVQEATGIIDSLNQAGKAGGISGIFDAALAQIPKLLPKVVKGVQGLLQGLGKRLPGFVKGLMAGLPEMLGGISELAPGLADALFDGAAQAVESLIGMLPQLAPKLLEGVWNLGLSVLKGAGNVLDGLLDGIFGRGKLDDYLSQAVSNADTSLIELKDIQVSDVSIDGEIDTSAYTEKIAAAKAEIEEAIAGLELSDKDAEAIKNAIYTGSGAEALDFALKKIGVSEAKRKEVVEKIEALRTSLNGAFDEFNLDDTTKQKILDYVNGIMPLNNAITDIGKLDPSQAEAALSAIDSTLDAVLSDLGLDEGTKSKIKSYVDAGGSLQVALETYANLDATDAKNAADKATSALEESLSGLDLPKGAAHNIAKYVALGGRLEDALQIYGDLSAEDAKKAAAKIQPDLDEIAKTYNSLNLKNISLSDFTAACTSTNGEIRAALKMLGLDDEDIEAALASSEALANSISTRLEAAFSKVKTAFTNGKVGDDVEAAENFNAEADALAEQGHGKIDTWLAEYSQQLQQMNLSAEDYKKAVSDAEEKAKSMHDELDATISEAKQWVEDNAGAKTSEVEAHVSELESFMGRIESLEARIESLRVSMNPEDYTFRTAVANGYTSDQSMQVNAIQLTYKERQAAIDAATLEYTNSMEAAGKEYEKATQEYWKVYNEANAQRETDINNGISNEEATATFNEKVGAAEEALAAAGEKMKEASKQFDEDRKAAIEAADASFNEWMELIFAGMLKSVDGLDEGVQENIDKLRTMNLADAVYDALANPEGRPTTVDDLKKNLGITDEMWQALAESMGMDVQYFEETLGNAFAVSGDENMFQRMVFDILGKLNEAKTGKGDLIASIIEGLVGEGGDMSKAAAVIQTALESGFLEGIEGVELTGDNATDAKAILEKMLSDYIQSAAEGTGEESEIPVPLTVSPEIDAKDAEAGGESVSEGVATGILNFMDQAITAVTTVGKAVVSALDDSVGHHSPSSYGQEAGASIPEGVALGIESGTGGVTAAAKSLGTAAVNAVKGSATGTDSAGLALAAGVARGILAGRSQVVNAAILLAQATVQAIREALQIRSPSRVGISLGANFGDAFGSGLEDSLNTALRSAQTVVGLNNLSPKMDFGGLTGSFGRALQGFADAESDRPVDVYINGRKVGGTMDRDNARAAANYNRRIAFGYGK